MWTCTSFKSTDRTEQTHEASNQQSVERTELTNNEGCISSASCSRCEYIHKVCVNSGHIWGERKWGLMLWLLQMMWKNAGLWTDSGHTGDQATMQWEMDFRHCRTTQASIYTAQTVPRQHSMKAASVHCLGPNTVKLNYMSGHHINIA